MSNQNKYNIQLTIREKLVVHRLTNTQEESFIRLAEMNREEIKRELAEDDDDLTPMDWDEDIMERLTIYDHVRQFPNSIFDHSKIVNSEAVIMALQILGESYPSTVPEVESILRKLELIRAIETTKN